METLRYTLALILMISIPLSECFFPQPVPELSQGTLTHRDITQSGIFRAIAKYLRDYSLVSNAQVASDLETIRQFYGSDGESFNRFQQYVKDITDSGNYYQCDQTYSKDAYRHFNGEQLEIGNAKLMQMKTSMVELVSSRTVNYDLVRQRIGQYLYSLQAFYSNTNWVEMYDTARNPDLGKRKFSIKVADSKTKVCDDCKDVNSACYGNIRVKNILTSGFRMGQDVVKPRHKMKYKCSHGGLYDNSRWFRARSGINKDSYLAKYSPHNYLHKEAALAAINATDDFIGDTGNGLLGLCGHNHFRAIFNLRTKAHAWKTSLAFAIDVSGSMGPVIKTVIDVTAQAVSARINSQNEPADYVLSTFNDPESLTTGYSTTNGYSMTQRLQSLTANGGGDCPEYALSGLLKAVELSQPNSIVYLYTDASAKDANRILELIAKARSKNIAIHVLMWGRCSSIYTGRNKRDFLLPRTDFYVFDQIANETGGVIHNSSTSDLPSITEDAIEDSLPSALVLIDFFEMKLTDSDERSFYVESNLTTLRVQAVGPTSESDGTLIKPDGSEVDFTTENANRLFILSRGLFMTVGNPEPGQWKVRRLARRTWSQVNVTTQSLLSYSFEILDIEDVIFPMPVKGNLLQGKTYKLLLTLTTLSSTANVTDVLLRKTGNDLQLSVTDVSNSETERRFQTVFVANESITAIVLSGNDESGMAFQRATPTSLLVVDIELQVQRLLDSVVTGKAVNLSYTLINTGMNDETLVCRFLMNGNNIDQVTDLAAGENTTKYFQFVAPGVASAITYRVQVWKQSAPSVILQEMSGIVEVTSKSRATCSIGELEGDCPESAMNTIDCSMNHWRIKYDIQVGDVAIDRIFMSNEGPLTNLTVNTGNSATVTGDCCDPNIILNILDTENYLERCNHDFANGVELTVIDTSDDPENIYVGKHSTSSTVWVIVGVVSVVAVVFAATVFLMVRKKLFAPKLKGEKNFNAKKKFDPRTLQPSSSLPK